MRRWVFQNRRLGVRTTIRARNFSPTESDPVSFKLEIAGRRFSRLERHLRADHAVTQDECRDRWSLPANYPMTAPAYSRRRQDLAREVGLGRKKS